MKGVATGESIHTFCFLWLFRDAPLDIWGEARVFVACKLFFTSERKQSSFLAINVRQFFFYVPSKNFFSRMLSLLCRLPFGVFSGQHIFHKFRQQTFFFCPHIQQTFFSDFYGDKLFLF